MSERYSSELQISERGHMLQDMMQAKYLVNTAESLGKKILSTKEMMDLWKDNPIGFVAVISEFMKMAKFDDNLPFYFKVTEGVIMITQKSSLKGEAE